MKKLFLGLILIILFAGATLFLLNVSGVYTFETMQKQLLDQANQWPIVSEYIGLKKDKEKLQNRITELEDQLATSQNKNNQLNSELQRKDEQIANLKEQVSNLESQLATREKNEEEYQAKVKKLADIYNEMEPARAADVLANLNIELTADVLNEVDNDVAASILNQIPTEIAVQIANQVTTNQ